MKETLALFDDFLEDLDSRTWRAPEGAPRAITRDLGLKPSPPSQPLPEITEEDVHLVCWLAIVPSTGSASI
jgi:hypothetical protein